MASTKEMPKQEDPPASFMEEDMQLEDAPVTTANTTAFLRQKLVHRGGCLLHLIVLLQSIGFCQRKK